MSSVCLKLIEMAMLLALMPLQLSDKSEQLDVDSLKQGRSQLKHGEIDERKLIKHQ